MRKLLLVLFVAGITASLAPAPADDEPKGSPLGYRKQWAVIIGINYDNLPEAHRDKLRLKNPENDARALVELLVKQYWYTDKGPGQSLYLLLGKDATKEAIESLLADDLLSNQKRVGDEDSVLFYFAGHAALHKADGTANEGFLYPADLRFTDQGAVKTSSCLRFKEDLLNRLEKCPARHKLLLLDCCHAGQIFKDDEKTRGAIILDPEPVGPGRAPGSFKDRAFQAFASARAEEEARDTGSQANHSPFTEVLLKQLQQPPAQFKGEPFTVSELYGYVRRGVLEVAKGQEPQLGRIKGGGGGDYYFFPLGNGAGPKEQEGRLVLETLPSIRGRWWFEEAPWLLPAVRASAQIPASRGALTGNGQQESKLRELVEEHMTSLRKAKASEKDKATREEIERTLLRLARLVEAGNGSVKEALLTLHEEVKGAQPRTASEWHLQALLQHTLEPPEKQEKSARESYKTAIDLYQKEGAVGLKALCHFDLGFWYSGAERWKEAQEEFRQAILLPEGVKAPAPLRVVCLCNVAEAYVRQVNEARAKEALRSAQEIAESDLGPDHPLTAYVYERQAWAAMYFWRLPRAVEFFKKANRIREGHLDKDLQAKISVFHNLHGLAMAARFQGDPQGALDSYLSLYRSIGEALYSSRGFHKKLLVDRRVNTAERIADCYLFSPNPSFEKALEYLEEAHDRVKRDFAPVDAAPLLASYLYRTAIAQAKLGRATDARRTLDRIRDEVKLQGDQARSLEVRSRLAEGLVLLAEKKTAEGAEALRGLIRDRCQAWQKTNRRPFRDDLEMLLFGSETLLATGGAGSKEDVEDLMLLCRMAVPAPEDRGGEDRSTLRYLRRYYDAAIGARLAVKPSPPIGDLMRYVYEARTGKDHRDYDFPDAPLLMYYLRAEEGHVFLRAGGQYHHDALPGLKLETVRKAIQGRAPLALPEGNVSRALKAVTGTVEVYWEDEPVLGLRNAEYPFTVPIERRLIGAK